MTEPSASARYLAALIAGAMEAGDKTRLRDIERSLPAPHLTDAELRPHIWR